jgi:hypothetical protein
VIAREVVYEANFEEEDAKAAGAFRTTLETAGRPIGAYDLLMAGQALRNKVTLVTANVREFGRVKGLPPSSGCLRGFKALRLPLSKADISRANSCGHLMCYRHAPDDSLRLSLHGARLRSKKFLFPSVGLVFATT